MSKVLTFSFRTKKWLLKIDTDYYGNSEMPSNWLHAMNS
jgi:hypothetical protein